MSVPRLTFLYPHLFKSARCYDCSAPYRVPRAGRKAGRKAALSTSARGRQETYAQRYGPANDPSSAPPLPPPSPQDQRNTEDPKSLATAIEKEVKSPTPKRDEKESEPTPKTSEKATSAKSSRDTKEPSGVVPTLSSQNADESVNVDASESHPKENVQPSAVPTRKPLERVLKMGSPDEEHKPPHLQAPPYIHHFDTFTLVKNLEQGGFTQAQSITLMKAVRSLLALNLDVAREGLVSKSDVENVLPQFPHFAPSPPPHLLHFHPSLNPLLTYLLFDRKLTSSAPPAPNSAPRSFPSAAPLPPAPPPNAPTSNTPSTSSPSAPPKKPSL